MGKASESEYKLVCVKGRRLKIDLSMCEERGKALEDPVHTLDLNWPSTRDYSRLDC